MIRGYQLIVRCIKDGNSGKLFCTRAFESDFYDDFIHFPAPIPWRKDQGLENTGKQALQRWLLANAVK